MNIQKHLLRNALLLACMAISVVALPAAAQGNFRAARGRMGRDGMYGAFGFVRGLNLTADQKTQIKGILQSNKNQILQMRRDVVKAQLDRIKGLPDAATELANATTHAANLRKQILEQIKPILTADQLAKVQERQQQREQRLQNMLDRLNNRISG